MIILLQDGIPIRYSYHMENRPAITTNQDVLDPNDTQAVVENILPHFTDNSVKNRYLSFRASGFTVNEAVQLAGTSYPSVMRWRHQDHKFKELDTNGLSELRDQVGTNYIRMEFTRNLRLFLEHDRQIITKAVANHILLSPTEQAYLRAIRQQYTPQQMQALEMVLAKELPTNDTDDRWDLRSIVLRSMQNGRDMELSLKVGGQEDG